MVQQHKTYSFYDQLIFDQSAIGIEEDNNKDNMFLISRTSTNRPTFLHHQWALGCLFVIYMISYCDHLTKLPAIPLFVQWLIYTDNNRNIKTPHYWPLRGESTSLRWIPHRCPAIRKAIPCHDTIMENAVENLYASHTPNFPDPIMFPGCGQTAVLTQLSCRCHCSHQVIGLNSSPT